MGRSTKRRRIVEVEWIDSCGNDGWHRDGEDEVPSRIVSTGYLVKSDRKAVVIAQSFSSTKNRANALAIPKSCIKAVRIVRTGHGS